MGQHKEPETDQKVRDSPTSEPGKMILQCEQEPELNKILKNGLAKMIKQFEHAAEFDKTTLEKMRDSGGVLVSGRHEVSSTREGGEIPERTRGW